MILRSLIDGHHRRLVYCAIKKTCAKKYIAEFNSLNITVQVVNIAHTRSIELSIKCIDNDIAQLI